MQIKKSDWAMSIGTGVAAGLILVGGAMLQDQGITPLNHAQEFCAEDDPCWDSRTMGNHKAGQNHGQWGTVCTWDGSAWQWDLIPGLPCPWDYSKN